MTKKGSNKEKKEEFERQKRTDDNKQRALRRLKKKQEAELKMLKYQNGLDFRVIGDIVNHIVQNLSKSNGDGEKQNNAIEIVIE